MKCVPGAVHSAGNAPRRDEKVYRALPSQVALGGLDERNGLRTNPSADEPESFFAGGDRQYYLESLRHLCSFGDMFLVLAGAPGAGRSQLLEELWLQEKSRLEFRSLKPEDCASLSQLAQSLWALLRQSAPPSSNPIQAIEDFFRAPRWQAARAKRWVLLIDDADTVPIEVLHALALAFGNSDRTRAPVPLAVGADGLAGKLKMLLEDGSQWLHELAVRPLNEEESGQFVEHCLKGEGAARAAALDHGRRRQLHLRSGGHLGRLKQISPEVTLGRSQVSGRHPVPELREDSHAPWRIVLWLVLVSALLGASYAVVSWRYGASAVAVPVLGVDDRIDEVERLRLAMSEAERSMRYAPDEPVVESNSPAAEESSAGDESVVQAVSPLVLPESLDLVVPEVPVREPGGTAPSPSISAAEPQPPGPERAAERESAADKAQPLAANVEQGGTQSIPGLEPGLPSQFRDQAWVDRLPPQSFVVQLLGSYSESTAVRLVEAHPEVELRYVRSVFRGRQWFVVLLGAYDSRAAARAAIGELPESLRQVEPWVRAADDL